MALIQKVKDDEERKRKAQAQANQTAQTATTKAAQQNSDAAKRNIAGANKAPTQSAAATIQAAKQKAASGNVTKTPTQYADKSMRQRPVVKRSYNYKTLGTQERVEQVASKIADPKEKQGFLDGWTAYTETKSYKNDQKRKEQLQGLAGLYDADGRPININTASYNQVVQGIRSIADATKRKEAASKLEEMTKTWGSRFYGQTYTKDIVTSYLGSPDFTEAAYKEVVKAYDNAFYAKSGYEEKNAEQYLSFYNAIDGGNYTDSVKRQLKEALNASWKNTTGKNAPSVQSVAAANEAVNTAQEAANVQAEEDKPNVFEQALSAVSRLWNGDETTLEEAVEDAPTEEAKGGSFMSGEWLMDPEWVEEWKKEHNGEMPKVSDLPGYNKYASATVSDVKQGDAPTYLTIGSDADVLRAYNAGQLNLVRPQDKAAFLELAKSPTVMQMLGTIADEGKAKSALVGNDAAEQVVHANIAALGTTAYDAYAAIMSEAFPSELREDAMMVLLSLGKRADDMQEAGTLGGDDMLPALERLLETDEASMNELKGVYAARDELIAQRNELRTQQEKITQQALDEAREAVRIGEYSEEQLAMVQANIPADIQTAKLKDPTYKQMHEEVAYWDWGYFDEDGGAFFDSALCKNLESSGVTDTTDYRFALSTQMENVLANDTRTAMSLGMSLENYYARMGGMSYDTLANRASMMIGEQGASVTQEEMDTLDQQTEGAGIGAGSTFGLGVLHGTNSLYASYADSLYIGLTEANVVRTASMMQVKYQKEYGILGREMYRADFEALLDSGTLDESHAKALREAMDNTGDIFALGIDPTAFEGLRVSGAKAEQNVNMMQAYVGENGTAFEQDAFGIISGMTRNAEQALVGAGVTAITGNAKVGFAAAYSVPGFGDSVKQRYDEGYGRNTAAFLAAVDTAGSYLANQATFENILGRATGAKTLMSNALSWLGSGNPTGAVKAMAATKAYAWGEALKAGAKTLAQNIIDEAVFDESKEGLMQSVINTAIAPIFRKADNGEDIGAADLIGALVSVKDVDFAGVVKDVANNFVNVALTNSIFAVAGAAGSANFTYKGVNTAQSLSAKADGLMAYDSVKLAVEIANGRSKDVQGFMDAYKADMKNPVFVEAFNTSAQEQSAAEKTAMNIAHNDGSDGKAKAIATKQEQIKAHEAKATASQTAIDTAVKSMNAAQGKIDNGTADEADVQVVIDGAESIAKNKNSLDESTREAEQKKAEVKALQDEVLQEARAKAARDQKAETARMMQSMVEMAPQIAENARQGELANIEKRIDDINAQIQQEFDKGDDADYELIDSLSAQSGVLAAYLDDAQNPDAGEVNAEAIRTEVEQRLNEIADRKDAFVSAETRAVMEARETTRRLESEQADLKSVFDRMRSDSIYVDETQAANILYETGAKNLSEVNRRFKTKLTKTAGKGTPLDGSYYAELKALAPGYFKEAWDAHPEEAIVSLAQRQKLLKQEILDSKDAEKEANEAYRAKASKRFKAVDEAAATIPPGYALSQFENQNIQSSDVSTEDTNEVVKGTTHKIDTFDSLEKKAVSRIAKSGLKNTVAELMRADRMSNEDIATGREALKMLKKNGDILRHAMLAVKLGKESSKAGKELGAFALFQRNMAESAASDTLDMAEAYNKRKGKFATRIEDLDGDEQLSLGETQYQPFMDAQVSRSSSDPAMQKLSSDVAERSGLSMYWADMPEGIRGFFDRDRGVIVLNQKIGASQGAYVASIHEYTHFMEQSEKYGEYADAVLKAAYGAEYKKSSAMLMDEGAIRDEYAERGKELTEDLLRKELVAAATEQILLGDEAFMRNLFGGGNGGVAVRILSGMDSFLRKNQAKREGKEAVQRYELIQAARAKMQDAIANSGKWKAEAAKSGDAQHMLVGRTEDGKGIYKSNFDPDTPKSVKIDKLVDLWQNVWSKQPIDLDVVGADGVSRKIQANFDPDYDPSNERMTDLGKVVHNKNGSSGDRTITLNLADDLYDLAGEARQVDRAQESGKTTATHEGVKEWRYFSNDFVYRDENGDKPMTLWLDLKEREDGGWVYQLYARKTKKKEDSQFRSPDGSRGRSEELSSSTDSVAEARNGVNPQMSIQVERGVQGAQTQLGNQQMISDPDTYDRIGAQMPNAPVEMRAEPSGEQTQIQDPAERDVNEVTRRVLANIDALQQEDVNSNNEWNLPLNQFQRDKIEEYGLYGVKLPGLNYNRATKKQRMLCAILSTPQDRVGPNRQTLTQQLKDLNSGKLAVVTEADYNYILSQAAIVEGSATDDAGVPLNREGEQAYGRLRDAQANIQPASRAEKLSAWRYINLLSSPVTTIKNIDGNLLIQEAERVSSLGAAWIDRQISKKTGNRTTSYAKRSEKKAGTEAAIKRGRDAYDDYFVAKTSTSRSRNYNAGGDGRVFQTEAFETARNIINFAMDAPDQMFMEKTIVEEMAILKRIGAKIRDEETGNMRDMTDGEMYEEAYNRASERFYHDDNRMVKIMNEIYNVPALGTVARVLVPFAKTPSNVALRMFDYSPLGLAKSILYDGLYMMNHGKAFSENGVGANFDQRKFVMGMGRGLTGTALTAVGMMLYGIGAIEFGREEEENKKRRNVLSNLGTPYSMYFNIGDTKHEIAFTMPALAGFVIGAGIAERVKDRESLWNIAVGVVSDQVNQFFDNSYLSSLNEVLSGYEEGSSKFFHMVEKTAESYLSQTFSPSALRAFAKAADPYTRDTTSSNWMRQMLNEIVVQNWPFIRQTLPIKYDLTGDAMTQHKAYQAGGVWENAAMHWVDSLLSPTATYSEKDDPALVELLDLSYATNDTGCLPTQLIDDKDWSLAVTASFAKKLGYVEDKKGTPFDIDLSDDEKREVNREYSSLLFNGSGTTQYMDKDGAYTSVVGLREMLESDDWKNAEDDAERVKMVKAKIEEVKLFIMKKVTDQKKKDGEL